MKRLITTLLSLIILANLYASDQEPRLLLFNYKGEAVTITRGVRPTTQAERSQQSHLRRAIEIGIPKDKLSKMQHQQGLTELFLAGVQSLNPTIVKFMLDQEANPHATDKDGNNAWHYLLRAHPLMPDKEDPYASEEDDESFMVDGLYVPNPFRAKDTDRQEAAAKHMRTIATILCTHQVSLFAANRAGYSPLHLARTRPHLNDVLSHALKEQAKMPALRMPAPNSSTLPEDGDALMRKVLAKGAVRPTPDFSVSY